METGRVTKLTLLTTILASIVSRVSAVIPTPFPTLYPDQSSAMYAAQWNFQAMLPIAISVYTNPMGSNGMVIFAGAVFITLFVSIAIRQESVLIPVTLLAIFAYALGFFSIIPQTWAFYVIVLMFVLPMAGIMYTVFKTKR